MHHKTATVFGGTGFIGSLIVGRLARAGYIVRVATRVPASAFKLKTSGNPGQVVAVACDYSEADITAAVKGGDVVVNCIGILFAKRKGTFAKAHTDIPAAIARAAQNEGVRRLVHISALGVEDSKARYARSKHEGEQAVHANFPGATILRPSVVFGPDDNFFNMFAKMAGLLPFLPLIGGGKTLFQPVYAGDVADAVIAAVDNDDTRGQIFALGGPDVVSFKDLLGKLTQYTKQSVSYISLPFWVAKIDAFFLELLPTPPLTRDQVELLKKDNIVPEGAKGLKDLGITATSLDTVLPRYLGQYVKSE